MEPIFASDEIHINDHVNDVASVSHTMNLSSWGTVLVANASKARKLVRRDDLAAAKVIGGIGPRIGTDSWDGQQGRYNDSIAGTKAFFVSICQNYRIRLDCICKGGFNTSRGATNKITPSSAQKTTELAIRYIVPRAVKVLDKTFGKYQYKTNYEGEFTTFMLRKSKRIQCAQWNSYSTKVIAFPPRHVTKNYGLYIIKKHVKVAFSKESIANPRK